MFAQLFRIYVFAFLLFINLPLAYSQNTYYGSDAGTGGNFNTHFGIRTGPNSTAYFNTLVGYQSGRNNTTGGGNSFFGSGSGYRNTTGYSNTFIGHDAGGDNTSGEGNVFLGAESGYRNTTGRFNTFLGDESGFTSTTGHYNTFVGQYSGYYSETGDNNTYLGRNSGYNNTTGNGNVYIGNYAGYFETSSSNKLIIENNEDKTPLLYGDFNKNSIGIGKKYTGTAYTLFLPGKMRATAYDVASDKRLKKDINKLESSLANVQKIDGISYLLKNDPNDSARTIEETTTKKYYGFVAQDIQKIYPDLVTEDEGILAVNYLGLIPVLVEAIKELSAERESLKQEINTIKLLLEDQKNGTQLSSNSLEQLQQNQPNPFQNSTSISYTAPENANEISLIISNLNGVEVLRQNNLKPGNGTVEINAGSLSLPAGTYIYTLVVDGIKQSSQKMILSR